MLCTPKQSWYLEEQHSRPLKQSSALGLRLAGRTKEPGSMTLLNYFGVETERETQAV